jgi:DNA repair exonuclease SbcCD nuclease subunit
MVKYVISVSDIHISNYENLEEIEYFTNQFIDYCNNFMKDKTSDEVRIVIAGDIFDKKNNVSNEGRNTAVDFLRKLDNITKTYVIYGNHDFNVNNKDRIGTLSSVFHSTSFKQVILLDKELDYKSGIYEDENIVWCLYSAHDNFKRPTFQVDSFDKTYIGLIHGDINGAQTDTMYTTEECVDTEIFEELNFVIAGHIHKRQEIKKNGVKIVYCGSLKQQNMGENITGHGGVIWNIEEETWEPFDLERGEYGYFKFEISDIEDIINDKEKLINL